MLPTLLHYTLARTETHRKTMLPALLPTNCGRTETRCKKLPTMLQVLPTWKRGFRVSKSTDYKIVHGVTLAIFLETKQQYIVFPTG